MCTFTEQLPTLYPLVRSGARRLTRDYDQADDLTQTTIIKAFLHKESYRHESSIATWIFPIMRNTFLTRRPLKLQWEITIPIDDVIGVLSAEDDILEEIIEEQRMEEARRRCIMIRSLLDQIPLDQRMVVTLIAVKEKSYRDASQKLGIPEGTVKSRFFRGCAILRKLADGGPHYHFIPRYKENGRPGFYLFPV